MEGDLSLSQSLGGLRIANPDDEAPTFTIDFTRELESNAAGTRSAPPEPAPSQTSPVERLQDASVAGQGPNRPSPTDGMSVNTITTTATTTTTAMRPPPMTASSSSSNAFPQPAVIPQPPLGGNNQDRTPFPQNQFPAQAAPPYPPQGPFASAPPPPQPGRPGSSSIGRRPTRPNSVLYNQSEPLSQPRSNGNSNYRIRDDPSRLSLSGKPIRSDSRSSSSAMQAGVPTREESHTDRSYRSMGPPNAMANKNGPLPPRRSSKGVSSGPGGSVGPPRPETSGGVLSGSPYGLEGGPLPSSEEWKERGAAKGVQRDVDQGGRPIHKFVKKGVSDFNFGRTLGEGSYSTVMAATDRQTLRDYAIKVLDKRHIIKEKKVKYVNIEKDALNRLTEHPGIVRLYYTFQDESSLYFVLDVASGGELLGVLKRMTTFNEECAQFYGAQILDAVEYMHSRGIIHRDLKPENVLLDDSMHVKITDFGTAKILELPRARNADEAYDTSIPLAGSISDGARERSRSFVGTAEYVSPELLGNQEASKACDLWAFGCIIYQLLAGRPPFKGANEYQTFQKILNLEYEFPAGFSQAGMDLVERLLVLDPAQRLPIEHVKNHEFFRGIRWGRGLWKQKAPRLRSYVPPTQEPNVIKLNGYQDQSPAPNVSRSHGGPSSSHANGGIGPSTSRSHPRVITDLPPPSQLDIDWSPVLTGQNERILKLGNLVMQTGSVSQHAQNSGEETPKKFARLFGGGGMMKKRERLVMVTSSGRILMVAAGGEEKKIKMEISLFSPGFDAKGTKDSRGYTAWCVEIGDKVYTFEDPKIDSNSAFGAAMEWLETIERAKGLASQNANAVEREGLPDLSSAMSSPASVDGDPTSSGANGRLSKNHHHHHTIGNADPVEAAHRKRFSKRHSKNGLAAVF